MMTTTSPMVRGDESDKSGSVHWTSIKLNVIMIPVSVVVVVALIAFVCLCQFIRNKRNKELARQRQKEIRMSRKNCSQKLKDELKNHAHAKGNFDCKLSNGMTYSPRPNRQTNISCKVKDFLPTEVDKNKNTISSPKCEKEDKAETQTSPKDLPVTASFARQGTFTVEEDNNTKTETEPNRSSSPRIGVEIKEPVRKNTYTIESDTVEQLHPEDRSRSISTIDTDSSNSSSPVKVILRNGTIGVREKLPYPSLNSPTDERERKKWDKPPPAYLTTKLLTQDRKVIPPINPLPVVK